MYPLPKSVSTTSCGLPVVMSLMILSSTHCVTLTRYRASSRHNALLMIPAAAIPSASKCEKTWMEPSFCMVSLIVFAACVAAVLKLSIWVFVRFMIFTFAELTQKGRL